MIGRGEETVPNSTVLYLYTTVAVLEYKLLSPLHHKFTVPYYTV